MRKFLLLLLVSCSFLAQAQVEEIYNPKADARAEIDSAVNIAKLEGKHVLLQIGGNWCVWCRRFHQFVADDADISQYVKDNFVKVMVNYSPENRNEELLKSLEFPQRFGFPVFVVLDTNGHRIHTQNSAYLEAGGSYDKQKVLEFFKHWAPAAVKPESYSK